MSLTKQKHEQAQESGARGQFADEGGRVVGELVGPPGAPRQRWGLWKGHVSGLSLSNPMMGLVPQPDFMIIQSYHFIRLVSYRFPLRLETPISRLTLSILPSPSEVCVTSLLQHPCSSVLSA